MKELERYSYQVFRKSVFELSKRGYMTTAYRVNAGVVRMKLEKEQALYQACLDKAEFRKQNIKMYEASLLNTV